MVPTFDAGQVLHFIKLLTGSEDTPVTWQIFYDPKGEKRDDLAARFVSTYRQAEQYLVQSQNNLCGVYIGINGTDGRGRKAANIVNFRALFADFDGVPLPPSLPAQPHILTQRDAVHSHLFWLVSDITSGEQFSHLQRRIALYLASDEQLFSAIKPNHGVDLQVVNPDRVVRAPGTIHYKNRTAPAQYKITQANSGRSYTVAEIEAAFVLPPQKQALLDQFINGRDAVEGGTGFADNPVSRQRFIKFMTVMAEPAMQGSGTATLIRVAGYGFDQGLPLEVAQDLLWEHYDPRCVPSWHSTGEKDHFYEVVERAYHYAKNDPGCKTAVANFATMPPIPVAPPPPTVQEIIRTGDRINKKDAAALMPMMNAKSPHYDLAKVFDGMIYDGCWLICCEKIFYRFNGKSWSIISDSVLESSLQRFYKSLKPADKLTKGIFSVLRTLVNVKSVENGTNLNTGEVMRNLICFKNGLVDLSVNPPSISPHTPNFFTFNELKYDYDVTARCDTWLNFLNDVFEYDPMLVVQLQEFMGYCLSSDVSMQKFAALVGKSRAGKGVIAGVIREMVGEHNTTAPSLANFAKDSALHKMATASVGLIPDAHSVPVNKRDEVLANFKAITGGDPMDFHVMYKGTQTSIFKIKLVLSTNGMPEFNDPSGALANRMLVFPFYKTFAGREDVTLSKRLMKEIPGIAQWALQGLYRLQQNGRFTEAPTAARERECIAEDMNPMARFISDACELDGESFVTGEELYRVYVLWARQHDVTHPLSQTKVVRELNSSPLGVIQSRERVGGKQLRGFKGLKLVKFQPV